MNVEKWILRNTQSLKGKTIAITGSTGGLGKALCRHLAELGADLLLVDRNPSRSMAWGEALLKEFPQIKIDYVTADLSDMASVKEATEKLLLMPLDGLIHNAGAYGIPRTLASTGFDPLFQINFISPYYMIRRLMPLLAQRGGRVVAVSSIAHRYSKADPRNIDFTHQRNALAYGNAKRYLTAALYALGEGAPLAITHPGISFTGITDHYPKLIFALIKHPMKILFMRPKAASLSILKGLFQETKQDEWIGPALFDIWGHPKLKKLHSFSPAEREHILQTAEKIFHSLT